MTELKVPSLCLPAGIDERKWSAARWFALYTRSRHEKAAERELNKKGVETFLPLRHVMRQWSDRRKTVEEPLFKSYLFAKTSLSQKFNILNTFGIVSIVSRSVEPIEVSEKDIFSVRKFVEQDIQIDPFPYLKEGQRVYVRSGPFKGTEGFVVRKDRHCRLVISVDALKQSVSVVIDEACVEPF